MSSCNVGAAAAHPFAWLLSSPQQPLETEDPPTVSLAPQYTSQPLCRAIEIFSRLETAEKSRFSSFLRQSKSDRMKFFHPCLRKIFSLSEHELFLGYETPT